MNGIKRYEVFLIALLFIAVNLHRIFDVSVMRADIYLLYDYEGGRLVSNILYEIGRHLACLIPAFILIMRIRIKVFLLCFVYLLLDFLGYILFFGQGVNLYIIIIISLISICMLWRKK